MIKRIIKIKLIIGIGILVALLLVHTVTAYLFGLKSEDLLKLQFKKMVDTPYVTVEKCNYKRGFFTSTMNVKLSLNNKALAGLFQILPGVNESYLSQHKYAIEYKTRVTHGVFAGLFDGEFLPTIAVAKTDIIYTTAIESMLFRFFGANKPIDIKNIIYLNKTGKILVSSPQFNYEEALSGVRVKWDGMQLSVDYNEQFNNFANRLNVPGFSIIAPTKGNLLLNHFTYASKTHYSTNNIKVGNTNLMLGSIKIHWLEKNNRNIMLGDLLGALTGISAIQFLNELDILDPMDFTLSKLSYNTYSSDNSGFFNSNALVNFESLITRDVAYGPLNLNLSVEHVWSTEFSAMMDDLSSLLVESDISGDSGREKIISTLKKRFGPILVKEPAIRINNFNLGLPSGLVDMHGVFTVNGFVLNDINNEQDFFNKLQIKLYFSLPKEVLSYLFMLQMKYFLSTGNADMDKQSTDALKKIIDILMDNRLSMWKKKGYIKEKNGVLVSNLTYEHGKLSVESQPAVKITK